jgi:HD-GYP domain-containing protein (c-di-GMP phosphodiesterase class II)
MSLNEQSESYVNEGVFGFIPGINLDGSSDDMPTPQLSRLEQLSRIGIALSREKDINRLLEGIVSSAKSITNADGGTLYRVTGDGKLKFEIMRTDSLGIAMGGSTNRDIPLPAVDLYDKENKPIYSNVVAYAYHHDISLNIRDAYTERGFDFSGTRRFDKKTGYRSKSFLTVPMKNHENEIIAVLQLLNAKDRLTGAVVPFSEQDQRLAESLASQAAVALTNRLLIDQMENLFEALVTVINSAIDEKSPYTGAHCDRVPVLTMMVAQAVSDCKTGPLKDFFMTEKDQRELKIAGLLHDCGKITTPVHVVDKATKLQTIYDRIGTIDVRFEVVRRDAEIQMLQAKLEGVPDAEHDFELRRREIEDDRNFLHRCNIGGEAMTAEDIARVKQISQKYTWRDAAGDPVGFLTEDEIENLTIQRGTLTNAERRVINHHIEVTSKILEGLPWPEHLRNVPEYACGHHERMDGKGYPKGLTGEQMSIQARCMAIADIFEALTAADRPYKKAKTLSEALEIMGQFKLNGHIDPDIFDVFVGQKVYLQYARQYLEPYQIDDLDLSRIPGCVKPSVH